jgi:hypothetical protein
MTMCPTQEQGLCRSLMKLVGYSNLAMPHRTSPCHSAIEKEPNASIAELWEMSTVCISRNTFATIPLETEYP